MPSAARIATNAHAAGLTPTRVTLAAGALGLATLMGMALGSLTGLTQDTKSAPVEVSQAPQTQGNLEEAARQAAIQQLAKAMQQKALAAQASDARVATTTTGAAASASLARAEEPIATPRTGGAQVASIPSSTVARPVASLEPEDMQRLAGKAAEAIRSGDIASARLVLEHAMRAGDATAIYALAETYDPRVLVKLRVQGMEGEPETARQLYQRALNSGVEEARSRL